MRTLLLDSTNDSFGKNITLVHCNPNEEALYAEYVNYDDETTEFHTPEYNTIELATNLEQIKRIRDFLNNRIDLIEHKQESNSLNEVEN